MMADSGDNVDENAQDFDVQEKEKKADSNTGDMETKGIHNDEAHLDPSRYWFASSAFPMIAATLGPVASAFSVCALVKPWRQNFPPGSDIDLAVFIDDPIWLTVVNAIQLAMALIANVLLLFNMARKVRFTIAQPVTIVTWYISSLCLIALTATAAGPLVIEPKSQYIWSGSFYYGIYAAVLYFFCSSLMVVTFWGAMKGYYPKDFQLTTSQRTLMLQTIMFLVYLLVGALVFSRIEGWDFLDAVYWADVTLFTVGFGDYSAATPLGRGLLFPYALIGIISLGLVVGSIRSLILERGRRQLGARMTEKTRKRMLRQMAKQGKDDILNPVVDDGLTEFQRRQKEFELMRKIQANAERRRRWMAMCISTTVWLCLWLVGAAIFQQCEVTYQGWTYFDGFYFAFVSLTTIGYGDVTPISPSGKSFFVFWSLLALPTMTVLVSNAGDTVVKLVREWTDWLGTITILPGERGFRKELKIFLNYLSLGKVFSDEDDNIKESPPGFLGNSDRRDDSEEDEEKAIAEEKGRLRPKSTKRFKDEVRKIVGDDRADRHDGETVSTGSDGASDTTYTGTSSMSEKDDSHKLDEDVRRTPASSNGNNGNNNSISFAEPDKRPSSSPKTGNSLNLRRTLSMGSSKSGKSHSNEDRRGGDVNSQTLPMSDARSVARTDLPISAPKDRHDLAVVLIDEISRVTQHMKTHPPRKYSFEEWAWFLRLIGEDESRADKHRKPIPKSRKKKRNGTSEGDEEDEGEDEPEKLQWSWVGSRSPLMGSQEEAEWILDKLEQRLADLLRSMRAEAKWKKTSAKIASKS